MGQSSGVAAGASVLAARGGRPVRLGILGCGAVVERLHLPATRRVEGKLYGDAEAWSLSALGLFSVVATWLEPDPEIVWDRERIDMVRKQLESEGNLLEAERE